MAKYIPSGGSVISGKYEKGLIYVDEEYKEVGIYKTQLQQMTLAAKFSDAGTDNYTKYLNQNKYYTITPSSILSATTLGSFEENNAELIDAAGRWFGTGAALVTSQLEKGQIHTVKIEYNDHTNSILNVNDYVYQTLIVIASQVKRNPAVENKNQTQTEEKIVCTICGYVNVSEKVPQKCPICHSVDSFQIMNMKTFEFRDLDKGYTIPKQNVKKPEVESNSSNSNLQENIKPENIHPKETNTSIINININPNNIEPTIDRIELFIEDEDWENAKAYCNAGLDYFPKDYRLYKLNLLAKNKVVDLETLIQKVTPDALEHDSDFKKALRFGQGEFDKEYEIIEKKVKEKEKERKEIIRKQEEEESQKREYEQKKNRYDHACFTLLYADSIEECESLAGIFRGLDGFENSNEKIEECNKKAKEIQLKEIDIIKKDIQKQNAVIQDYEITNKKINNEIHELKQDLENYLKEKGYSISNMEEEIKERKTKNDKERYGCIYELKVIEDSLNEIHAEYDSIKSSLFKKNRKLELLEKISELEGDLTEKRELLHSIRQRSIDLEKEYTELVVLPKEKINDIEEKIRNSGQLVSNNESLIKKAKSQIETDTNKLAIMEREL